MNKSTLPKLPEFKAGDQVRMVVGDYFIYGEVTIVTETQCKVLFQDDWDYTYYNKKYLELVYPKDVKE